ncbi:MAG: efflux RND transporter periplasmic adaptor subunit [Pseudomonadota bacterium]
MNKPLKLSMIAFALVGIGVGGGYWVAYRHVMSTTKPVFSPASISETLSQSTSRKVLYWYDPMVPNQHFDKPGKSPFMDMELVPQYAEESTEGPSVKVAAAVTQNLGMRLATVSREQLSSSVQALGSVAFNERDIAIVQARTPGFVEHVYAKAPGDFVKAGSPLVDVLVPEWAGLQEEFLALQRSGEPSLIQAARYRLRLAGMSEGLIATIARTHKAHAVMTVTVPISGIIQQLDIRAGMTVTTGQTFARINGIASVWLDVAIPEIQAGLIRVGQKADAQLTAFPGKVIHGRVTAILPEINADTRTLKIRIELPNKDGSLRPGLSAQVQFKETGVHSALVIPTEAVIRTGQRTIVMLAQEKGRYQPVEIETGQEVDTKTTVLRGLEEGQNVVVSGQFLIDSEASLKGIGIKPLPQKGNQP